MPETLEKPKRKSWTQSDVAALVQLFMIGGIGTIVAASDRAKLIELGLIAKPEKPALDEEHQQYVDDFVIGFDVLKDPQATLAIRYAIKSLQALLPKRAPKSP